MTGDPHIVVVGGGIAGLAAAHRLQQRLPGAALTLVESDRRLGGKIVTDRVDGFVIEGGPDTFLSYKPRGMGLCRELGLLDRLHGTNEHIRRTYVMRAGRLHRLPEGLTGLIPSQFGPMATSTLISPLGKVRMGLDYLIPPRTAGGDESLAAFVTRRLGHELYDRMIEPLLSGIYAGNGEELSLAATFPQLKQYEVEYGGLIKGMLAAKRRKPAPNGNGAHGANGNGARKPSAFVTPETGLAEIVEALEARLRAVGPGGRAPDVRLGTRVARLVRGDDGYALVLDGDGPAALVADAVVLATPAYVTADIVADLDPVLAATLRAIPYASTATVSLAYPLADIPRPLDSYGYIVPRAEHRPVLACTWTSTKFPHRAPEGWGLLRAFIGRSEDSRAVDEDDDALVQMVRDELRGVLGITAPPHLARVFRWPRAMPQYTLGHLERVAAVEERLAAFPGVYVAGNAYGGIGVPDCIQSGEQAADRAIARMVARVPAA